MAESFKAIGNFFSVRLCMLLLAVMLSGGNTYARTDKDSDKNAHIENLASVGIAATSVVASGYLVVLYVGIKTQSSASNLTTQQWLLQQRQQLGQLQQQMQQQKSELMNRLQDSNISKRKARSIEQAISSLDESIEQSKVDAELLRDEYLGMEAGVITRPRARFVRFSQRCAKNFAAFVDK